MPEGRSERPPETGNHQCIVRKEENCCRFCLKGIGCLFHQDRNRFLHRFGLA